MGKYDPLRRHLAAVPDDRREIGLSLREVESLVGTLPPSARGYRAWWGNHGSSPQAAAWLEAGFVVEGVDLSGERVSFVRPGVGYRPLARGDRPSTATGDVDHSEATVQSHLVAHLVRTGWRIERVADTAAREQGIDVVARRGACIRAIEVKGYPSRSYADARRAGERKPTGPSTQARHWYAAALLQAVLVRDAHPGYRVGIALPDVPTYRSLFARSHRSLDDLAIAMYFVSATGHVTATESSPGGECG
ncbi:DUF7662 domain-containing protein [Cryptosporangium minutisporangium]|uniref:DUF7662 domain-containing protein n=1 Tax=Cryptosporangium minutisporangium TaxID=113569 RepID=A0ABP6T2C9_9ACTN